MAQVDRTAPISVGASRLRRGAAGFIRLNWRLILAIIVNIFLWWVLIEGVRRLG